MPYGVAFFTVVGFFFLLDVDFGSFLMWAIIAFGLALGMLLSLLREMAETKRDKNDTDSV